MASTPLRVEQGVRPSDVGQIQICECWPRDGLQPWPRIVPTAEKLAVLDAIDQAGVPEVDLTAFSPTKQFSDSLEVITAVRGQVEREVGTDPGCQRAKFRGDRRVRRNRRT